MCVLFGYQKVTNHAASNQNQEKNTRDNHNHEF